MAAAMKRLRFIRNLRYRRSNLPLTDSIFGQRGWICELKSSEKLELEMRPHAPEAGAMEIGNPAYRPAFF
jgi:hypothetical protein